MKSSSNDSKQTAPAANDAHQAVRIEVDSDIGVMQLARALAGNGMSMAHDAKSGMLRISKAPIAQVPR